MATSGSRGDVEPFLALSKALKNAGYDVVLSAPPDFGESIASHAIAHHPAGEPARDIVNAFTEAIENDRFFWSLALAGYEQKFRSLFESVAKASQGADLLIYSHLMASVTFVAEGRETPAIGVCLAAGRGNGALPYGPSDRASPRLYPMANSHTMKRLEKLQVMI